MALRFRLFLGSSLLGVTLAASLSSAAERSSPSDSPDTKISVVPEPTESSRYLHDESKVTQGSITIAGHPFGYQSEAGILVVHLKDPLDDDAPPPREDKSGPPPPQPPEAGMSYVAYFRGDKEDSHRPITFLYNGGPGSSTVWLHMGAFGPKMVKMLPNGMATPPPYTYVDNPNCLLWNADGASFEEACAALGLQSGVIAVLGGPEAYGMFLDIGYDAFHLTRAGKVKLPGGMPVFPQVRTDFSPEDVLIRYGFQPGPQQILDAVHDVTLVSWSKVKTA